MITETQRRVLASLQGGGLFPHELYPIISPGGRFNTDVDTGSSKGGPSRMEYAANMYMGRLEKQGFVCRFAYLDETCQYEMRGKWMLNADGYRALRESTQPPAEGAGDGQ